MTNILAEAEGFEPPRVWPPDSFQDYSLQPDLGTPPNNGGPYRDRTCDQSVMSRALYRWAKGPGSGSEIWTHDRPGMSRMLYRWATPPLIGGADRSRTDDLLCAKQALYQLSYSPNFWSGRQDLNLRPLGPKPSALPSWATSRLILKLIGALGRIRTLNLLIRSQLLYPIKPRAHNIFWRCRTDSNWR